MPLIVRYIRVTFLPQPDRKGCCRTFLKDLGIIQERERKIEVIGNLKMLWERESDDRENDAVVIDAEANRVDKLN